MSLADVCWNISSVFIVITLGSDSDTLRTHAIRRIRMHLRP